MSKNETDFQLDGHGHGWPIQSEEVDSQSRRPWLAVALVLSGVFLIIGVALLLIGAARRARLNGE